ncbi:MAG: PleD family two-component system response regulator [Alphaproteobacteria bacterium]|nr:PleD family two-component system response regulator [Alphaproteobacteria bacterium]
MSARILVVDDIQANVDVLEAKLSAEYYDVLSANRGAKGYEIARREKPDIILLDVMMPDLDGFEVCRRLKADPETRHIPVLMLTALDGRDDRLRGLEAGAEDFLTKPIDDVQLMARVKSLTRLKVVIDELRSREASGRRIGVIEGRDMANASLETHLGGDVLVVDDNARQSARINEALKDTHRVSAIGAESKGPPPDLIIVSTHAKSFDGLKVIAKMCSSVAMRHMPILAVVEPDDSKRALRALDLGAHDVITRPIDEDELRARARTLIRRKRYMEALRNTLDQGLELAVTDQLTGLYNRRFMQGQLAPLAQRAAHGGDPVSVALADLDFFKRINDNFGHDAGDAVLKEFALRLASNTRPTDFGCRLGGEEFLVIMPATSGDVAALAAERLRQQVAGSPFRLPDGRIIDVTVSIGVATAGPDDQTPDALIKRADVALYQAKQEGRNRVIGATAASILRRDPAGAPGIGRI